MHFGGQFVIFFRILNIFIQYKHGIYPVSCKLAYECSRISAKIQKMFFSRWMEKLINLDKGILVSAKKRWAIKL